MSENNRALPSSPEEIEAAIAERRAHLADTVDELMHRAQPKAIARRSVRGARANLVAATHTESGELRTERVAAMGAAVLAVLALLTLSRRRRRRGRSEAD